MRKNENEYTSQQIFKQQLNEKNSLQHEFVDEKNPITIKVSCEKLRVHLKGPLRKKFIKGMNKIITNYSIANKEENRFVRFLIGFVGESQLRNNPSLNLHIFCSMLSNRRKKSSALSVYLRPNGYMVNNNNNMVLRFIFEILLYICPIAILKYFFNLFFFHDTFLSINFPLFRRPTDLQPLFFHP